LRCAARWAQVCDWARGRCWFQWSRTTAGCSTSCRISSAVGRRFRILTVFDDCTRECLALVTDTSFSGVRVARELDRPMVERGKPKMVVSDNGSELTGNAILTWADRTRVKRHYIVPGKPV
jgi:transposase InsO family protein